MPLALITGSNVGLGFETARGLAAKGFEVVITSRNHDRAVNAIRQLKTEYPDAVLASLPLDLSKSESIDSFASSFAERFGKWDVLINNAGAKVLPEYSETDYLVEYHYGVNAVGHFAITADLMKYRTPVSKVVSVSSIVARWASSSLGPSGTRAKYLRGESYGASKLSNLLFALELDRRFGSETFSSVAAHPGFARAEPYGPATTRFFEYLLAQSAARGALPIIEAASNSSVSSGSYRVPGILELWGKPKQGKLPGTCTIESQEKNWLILEKLSGRKLTL